MFGKLFKNKTNTDTNVPCTCDIGNEHCDLILQLREHQDLRKKIKNEIEMLNKSSYELLPSFINFLKTMTEYGARIDGFYNDCFTQRNVSAIERTIYDCSFSDIWTMTEELKRYKNKSDIICGKQRELKAVEDNIEKIKSKLGIE